MRQFWRKFDKNVSGITHLPHTNRSLITHSKIAERPVQQRRGIVPALFMIECLSILPLRL